MLGGAEKLRMGMGRPAPAKGGVRSQCGVRSAWCEEGATGREKARLGEGMGLKSVQSAVYVVRKGLLRRMAGCEGTRFAPNFYVQCEREAANT